MRSQGRGPGDNPGAGIAQKDSDRSVRSVVSCEGRAEGQGKVVRTMAEAEQRIAELEQCVSHLRHGVNGALTPGLMMADRLRADPDPRIQKAGDAVVRSILNAVELLKASRDVVAPPPPLD